MNINPKKSAKLLELLRDAGVNTSADDIYRAVRVAASDPEATASSLVRSVASVMDPRLSHEVLAADAQGKVRGSATAIIDLLVREGFLHFDGRRPRVAGDPGPRSRGDNTKA